MADLDDTVDLDEDRRTYDHPETLRLTAIAIGITVDDLQESLHWYCDVVGFHLEETWEHEGEVRGASLIAGAQRIMLSQDDGAKGERVKGQGIRLYLQPRQQVDRVAAWIRARGGQLASEPTDQPWGARTFDVVDPNGFQLTFTS